MAEKMIRHMFPGNNTSQGFFSYFDYILPHAQANRIYCLKGGPGVGKSTFLKRIGERMLLEGYQLEYLHCASDPDSLDGLVIPALGVSLVDGTAPHVTDPVYPAAVDEIIHLGEYWDAEAIRRNRDEIVRINAKNKRQYKRAYQYLSAAKCLMDDILETVSSATDKAGALLQAQRVIDEELTWISGNGKLGRTRRLFASAITPSGIVHHLESLADSAEKVYYIKNLWGVGVHEMLKKVADEALFRGLDVELYYCPLAPETRIEQLLIPELKLALISEQESFELKGHNPILLDLTQYTDLSQTESQKDATAFDVSTYHTLLKEAVNALSRTKKLHDDLEGYYIPHMNFERVQQKLDEVCQQILTLGKTPD
ncbi:PRK06851 family protein [Clostridium minihomine]|uniref:PRK06851 family protein n=1 Tax=Clostridium minihomine TaxID=2045012 RepID=UPI0013EC6E33|nr:PRK06851 family protein [Clostridium minihomine]